MKRKTITIAVAAAWLLVLGCGDGAESGAGTRFDGTWNGDTSERRAVELVIVNGRIAIFEIGYRVAGGAGCSRGDDVTLVPDPAQNRIHDDAFSFVSGALGASEPDGTVLAIDGAFADDTHLNGKLAITRHSPCTTESYLWSAAR